MHAQEVAQEVLAPQENASGEKRWHCGLCARSSKSYAQESKPQEVRNACMFLVLHRITCYLSLWTRVAHKASTFVFNLLLSCAAARTSLQDCHAALDLSLSAVRHLIVFGRPLLNVFLGTLLASSAPEFPHVFRPGVSYCVPHCTQDSVNHFEFVRFL